MYIETLTLKNFKNFYQETVTFNQPGEGNGSNINLLLGNNGSGKTTVMQAAALAILNEVLPQSGFVARNLIRKKTNNQFADEAYLKAKVTLHPQDSMDQATSCDLAVRIDAKRGILSAGPSPNALFDQQGPAFLVLGYGATRWAPSAAGGHDNPVVRDRTRLPRYQRIASLFEDNFGLMPIEGWLYQLALADPRTFGTVADLIHALLPDEIRMSPLSSMVDAAKNGDRNAAPLLFKMDGIKLPLEAYSDGYRNYIAWVADMVYHLWRCCTEDMALTDLRGVVLVDEIDLHLHPKWQQRVLERIGTVLKNLQFICTSHSPLVVGSLYKTNLFVMDRDRKNRPKVKRLDVNPKGLDADQLLLTPYFGMETTRAPAYHDVVSELYNKALKGDEDAALEIMRIYTKGIDGQGV